MENLDKSNFESEKILLNKSNEIISKNNYIRPNLSKLEKDSFEPIEYQDIRNEDSIFEVFKSKEYTETISNILNSLENYYNEKETYDDYPYFRIQNTCKFIPKLKSPTKILSERQLREIHANIPYYQQFKNFFLVFSPDEHGNSMRTFYFKTKDIKSYILVIKDENGNIFGCYISDEIKSSENFYGTGETFVFSFFKSDRIHCFPSTGVNDLYIRTDEDSISLGASNNLYSIFIKGDFDSGYTSPTQTFKNPKLTENTKFNIIRMEIWSFTDELI
jgi:hypothetical protein